MPASIWSPTIVQRVSVKQLPESPIDPDYWPPEGSPPQVLPGLYCVQRRQRWLLRHAGHGVSGAGSLVRTVAVAVAVGCDTVGATGMATVLCGRKLPLAPWRFVLTGGIKFANSAARGLFSASLASLFPTYEHLTLLDMTASLPAVEAVGYRLSEC